MDSCPCKKIKSISSRIYNKSRRDPRNRMLSNPLCIKDLQTLISGVMQLSSSDISCNILCMSSVLMLPKAKLKQATALLFSRFEPKVKPNYKLCFFCSRPSPSRNLSSPYKCCRDCSRRLYTSDRSLDRFRIDQWSTLYCQALCSTDP